MWRRILEAQVVFLELFLQRAQKPIMVGHRITRSSLTSGLLGLCAPPGVLEGGGPRGPHASQWQDVSMQHMAMVSRFCEQHFHCEVDDLLCADVDVKFCDHMGMKILSLLFGILHPSFYRMSHEDFSYQHWPQSQAHIPGDQGEVHYIGTFFGGLGVEVHRLTLACHQAMRFDLANGIKIVWCDKSHLNRYLLYHKPTKVLSPEDLWDPPIWMNS
ncbi:LOW QUALITY PROTEIN: histo-blood group ABO system transferase 2-like [Lutra lutra]|uniref:LOW QUALITY PROTEIN: histo-blood group ABO system transferase 2-like n=1 Tax=Lutra lutra TaxID=9657 RepID=UPI001FD03C3E|nr:LOW QUALITY PROTEIN: histo-blood group ABO system transferase 2-like [Lutra lutra]